MKRENEREKEILALEPTMFQDTDANTSTRGTTNVLLQLKSRTPVWRANGEQRYVAGKSSEPETGDMRHSRFHKAYSFVVQLYTSITL